MPKGYDGDCYFRNGRFVIRIEKDLPEEFAIDILIHEIAHVIAWGKDSDDHGLNWGKAYSKVYRAFLSLK